MNAFTTPSKPPAWLKSLKTSHTISQNTRKQLSQPSEAQKQYLKPATNKEKCRQEK